MEQERMVKTMSKEKIIAIDAGHGYNTAGKRCLKKLDPNQTREWYLNDRIADKVEKSLKNYEGCSVLRTDDTTGVKDVSLNARVKSANTIKADIVVSVHHNAGINGGAGGGTTVCCWSSDSSKAKAKRLYNAVVEQTGLKGNRANPISVRKDLYLIKNTNAPCLLLENGFMDSSVDVPIILSEAHADKTAQGIVDFLVKELNLVKKVVTVNVAKTYTVGQVISLKAGATYYNGKSIPSWVFKKTLYYRGKNSNGIIFSTVKTGAITGVVKPEYVL